MRPDAVSLVAGASIAALGGLLLLATSDVVDLSPGWLAAALTAAAGMILLVSGLVRNGADRHD
jgi:hypothetical protein